MEGGSNMLLRTDETITIPFTGTRPSAQALGIIKITENNLYLIMIDSTIVQLQSCDLENSVCVFKIIKNINQADFEWTHISPVPEYYLF
jgi:hypothetical protein